MELDSGKPGKGDQSQTKKKGTEEQFKQRGGVIDIEHYTDMVLKLLQNGTKWRPSWCMLSFCLSFCFVFVKFLDSGYLLYVSLVTISHIGVDIFLRLLLPPASVLYLI